MILRNKIKKRTLVSSLISLLLTFTNGGICGEAAPMLEVVNATVTPNLMVIQKNTLQKNFDFNNINSSNYFLEKILKENETDIEEEQEEIVIEKPVYERIVEKSKTYLKIPYKWGGTTPKGFDCSGFVRYVYKEFGYTLPRTTKQQIYCGKSVSKSDLREGDLVFFGSPVHHVGIYIGNNRYIHSPKTGDVIKISELKRRSDYNTARRICD